MCVCVCARMCVRREDRMAMAMYHDDGADDEDESKMRISVAAVLAVQPKSLGAGREESGSAPPAATQRVSRAR